jgi:predicted MFS family arabinose efflux permease
MNGSQAHGPGSGQPVSDMAAAPEADADRQPSRGLAARGLLLGSLVAPGVLGVSATVIALPVMSRDLAFSPAQVSWLVAGYVLTQAMLVAFFGRLADVAGIRTVLTSGTALIAAGSLLSAAGSSFPVLLSGRLLQGAGAGSLQVVAFTTAGAQYSGPARARVLGVITASVGVVSGSGPLIGGLLVTASWRIVLALPALSLPAMVATRRSVPATRTAHARLDTPGAALTAVIASGLMFLLEAPGLRAPSWAIPVAVAAVLVAVGALSWRVRRIPDGFLPLDVLRSRRHVLACLAALAVGAGYLGMLFAAPVLLAQRGWSPVMTGLILTPAGITGALAARLAGALISARDPCRVTAAFAAASMTGLLIAASSGAAPALVVIALALAVSGFTVGQVALLNAVPPTMPPELRAISSGLFILMFLLGGAIGSATTAGLAGPAGLATALTVTAAFPAAGAMLALAAATTRTRPPGPVPMSRHPLP